MLLENATKKLSSATEQIKDLNDFANSYLGTFNTFFSGTKHLVAHFKPCFKGLS